MRAVSNTTPLRYLIAIEQEHLLGKLFENVFVPVEVHQELVDARTPEIVRQWVASPPSWFEVRTVEEKRPISFPVTLHRGECQAILLSEVLQVDVLLIDERIGRTIALGRKIPISGTLGILERADALGLIRDFPRVLKLLKASGFFITDSLQQQLLERHRERESRAP